MPGYGLPEASRGLLPWSWAEERLKESHNYWLVTVKPDASPHAMPIWGLWHQGRFYFSTGRDSRKARNLKRNQHCVVCNEKAHEAVILEGTAKEVSGVRLRELLRGAGPAYARKYKPWKLDPNLGPVYEMIPRTGFGMWEKKFVDAATKWEF
jgi:nitroimidazol reductase NimA-like FMN-containing flavoprotein (pyridoxamine 5'-phosphate oxidase superfamily)